MKNLPQKSRESVSTTEQQDKKHTYLRVGDRVFHKRFKFWGGGVVIETRTSTLPGGACFVHILFQDGKKRVFDNSFASASCCYYTGITHLDRIEL